MGDDDSVGEPTEGKLILEESGAVVGAVKALLAERKEKGFVDGWVYAALACAGAAHHPTVRAGLWGSGAGAQLMELVAEAAEADGGTTLGMRAGWLYVAASWLVEAQETHAREPPRGLLQKIEGSGAPSPEESADLQDRAVVVAEESAAAGGGAPAYEPEDDGLSDSDRKRWRQQMVDAAQLGNLDFDDLAHASSLPTLVKLLSIPALREKAARTTVRVCMRARAPDLRTAAQKRLQNAAARARAAKGMGMWARPKTMAEIFNEAKWVVSEAADARAERTGRVKAALESLPGKPMGEDGEEAEDNGSHPVTKEELTALLQKHVTWGFIGGSDRFRVRVRPVISNAPEDGLMVLPAVDKRGPEHVSKNDDSCIETEEFCI